MSRSNDLEYQIEDDATGIPEATKGHVAQPVDAFIGKGRLIALAERALADLSNQTGSFRDGGRCSLYLCLTDQDTRRWEPEEPIPAEALRAQRDADERERAEVAERIVEFAGLDDRKTGFHVYASGAGGLAVAVNDAIGALRDGECDSCLVGGVDSLVTPPVLGFLHEGDRLKTPDVACGLCPGEAAAFWLLERVDRASQRNRPLLGAIVATAGATADDPDVNGRPPSGVAWMEVFTRLISPPCPSVPVPPWILNNQNGEVPWAAEWGDFISRAMKNIPALPLSPSFYPAVSFGDTGAAAGVLAGCIAVMAWLRGYSPSPTAIVAASTYEGARSGIRIDQII